MASLQIPTVTLEDLAKFQASHFFGASTLLTSHHYDGLQLDGVVRQIEEQGDAYYDEDNLGYYKDDTKRTLTDEQIKIFRHSEIHTLLRERERLREEAEEEAEAETEEAENEVEVDEEESREKLSDMKRKSTESSEVDDSPVPSKRAREDTKALQNDVVPVNNTQQEPSLRELNSGRKIVSYAED